MAGSPTVVDRADYGGVLLHLRQFGKAREVLVEAERLHPGNYQVAANLGTAYELLGDDENALVWIRKGIERNPDSHYGTNGFT
jgi:Flp pilus assembly protein TadD